jgi:hypothetical protein
MGQQALAASFGCWQCCRHMLGADQVFQVPCFRTIETHEGIDAPSILAAFCLYDLRNCFLALHCAIDRVQN